MIGHRQSHAKAIDGAARLASLPDVVLVLDEAGRIDFATAGSANYLGSRPRDWVGQSVLDRVHPNNVALIVDRLNLAQSGLATPIQALPLRVSVGHDQWQSVAGHGFVQINTDGLIGTLVMLRHQTGVLSYESQRAALDSVFNRRRSPGIALHADRVWITELLPLVLSNPVASGPLSAVVVMTLADPLQGLGTVSSALENPIGALAHRVRQVLGRRDVLTRLGTSQLAIVCPGLADRREGLELVQRLHDWCSPLAFGDASGASQLLTTGCAFATAGDSPDSALDLAASPAGHIESGLFALVAT